MVAFPYGMMADRIGRKRTALICYSGLVLSFGFGPVLIWAFPRQVRQNPYILMTACLWQVIGGGANVLMATLYAMGADVSSEKNK